MTQCRDEGEAGQDLGDPGSVQFEALDGPVPAGDGMGQTHSDLVLPHVSYNVKHCSPGLRNGLVGYSFQLKVEFLEEVFKQERQ